jgi:hypothetical protein
MLVNISAKVQEVSSLASNHPIGDWPVCVSVTQCSGTQRTILNCEGKIRVSELRAAVMGSKEISPNDTVIPEFVKKLEARETADVQNLEMPQIHLDMLLSSASLPYNTW